MSRGYVEFAQVYEMLTKRSFFWLFDKDLHKKIIIKVNNVNNSDNNPIFNEFWKILNVNNFFYCLLCQTKIKDMDLCNLYKKYVKIIDLE